MPCGAPLSRAPPNPTRLRDRAMPAHTAALGSTGVNTILGERGSQEGALPGTACSVPVKEGLPAKGGVSIISRGISLPFFSCLRFPVSICIYGVFFGDETLSSPRGFYFYILRCFFSAYITTAAGTWYNSKMEVFFFGDGTLSSPPGIGFSLSPGIFLVRTYSSTYNNT